MSKHTPGPWRAEGPDMFGDFNIIPPDAMLAVAAVVSNLRPAERVAANAAVVAAAPDLLDVARICLDAERERRKKLKPGAPATTYCEARIAKIEAAIAKAEGRS